MREYLEQQLKKKAHELVMLTFRIATRVKGNKGPVMSLRKSVSKIPVSIFEGQSRDFDEDKVRYFSEGRNYLFETRYYLDLLYKNGAVSYYSYRQCASRIDLLDKLLISRISSVDKRKAKAQYKTVIKTRYI